MLDFLKLSPLIQSIGVDSLDDIKDHDELVSKALVVFDKAAHDADFADKLEKNAPWVLWPLLRLLSPLDEVVAVPPLENSAGTAANNEPWTVVGVDGSQIMPSHHEVHSCYLLNCGIVRISYGAPLEPLLTSEPRLFARPDDLYPLVDRRRVHIDELFVSMERTLLELEFLVEYALLAKATGGGAVLAMVDGSLIPWSLEKMPRQYVEEFLARQESLMVKLRSQKIPLVGYVSHSRSSDVINALRVYLCPYESSHCMSHCSHLNEEAFPCSKVWPLADRSLFRRLLRHGERSALFASGASIVKQMPLSDATCFTYLANETEVARIEFPAWLAADNKLLHFALKAVQSQSAKGFGYPVCLAEAHHQAVVRGPEREQFFAMIKEQMLRLGVSRSVSPKESKKRSGFV